MWYCVTTFDCLCEEVEAVSIEVPIRIRHVSLKQVIVVEEVEDAAPIIILGIVDTHLEHSTQVPCVHAIALPECIVYDFATSERISRPQLRFVGLGECGKVVLDILFRPATGRWYVVLHP